MFFFLNDGINFNKSGIEHAQVKRLRLFKHHEVPSRIVTRQFALNLHEITRDAGIDDDDFVNLFDFFQGTMTYEARNFTIEDLQLPDGYEYEPEGVEKLHVKEKGKQIMIIAKRGADDERLNWVQYFGSNGRLVRMVWYDTRGFAALEQFFSFGTKLVSEQILAPSGMAVYQRYRMTSPQGEEETTLQRLLNYHGHDYEFADFEALTSFFLDQINLSTHTANTIIVDRTFELAYAVQSMDTAIYKVMHLHNNHLNDDDDILTSDLNFNYQYMIGNRKRWNGIIALTPWQRDEFVARYGATDPTVYEIPGAVTDQKILEKPHVPWQDRKKNSVIMVARLAPEKQQDVLIRAWQQVQKAFPDATLNFWGYSNGDTGQQLKELVKDLRLGDSVRFNDYTNDISQVYEQAQLLILPSRAEGLPLTLVEAQAHGLPIIASDVRYGARDIVNDGKDGFLVENGNVNQLAERIMALLADPAELMKFSEQAYQDSWKYSEEAVWKKWLPLVEDAKKVAEIPESVGAI